MRKTIVIDPGHGGDGAEGKSSPVGVRGPNGLLEKDVTLAIARRVATHLGAGTSLTRTGDSNLSLTKRAGASRLLGASAFVSVHANDGGGAERGAEVWIHTKATPRSAALAQDLLAELSRLGAPSASRVRRGDLAVLEPAGHASGTAACLLEVDFLDHPEGERRLRDPRNIDAVAQGIARGVKHFLERPAASPGPDRALGRREVPLQSRALDAVGAPVITVADSPLVTNVTPATACGLISAGGSYKERVPEKVVIHVLDGGDYASDIKSWNEGRSCTPPHYVIRFDGEITQMVAEKFMAQHAGPGGNPTMVGIEHDGSDSDPQNFTDEMYLASAALTRDICARNGIPVDRDHIVGHDEVPLQPLNDEHGDPGGYWDWDYYMALVRWDGVDAAQKPSRQVLEIANLSLGEASAAWHESDRDSGNAKWKSDREKMGPLYYSGYGVSYAWAQGAADAPADDAITFSYQVPQAGTWQVSAWWPILADASTAANIELSTTRSGPTQPDTTTVVNQRATTAMRVRKTVALPASPTWYLLPGAFELLEGDTITVRILRRSEGSGRVIADAVRFLKI